MTRIDGHGSVTLPAGYVAEHVQLGYAATEPGNQSDTATRSTTLATTATTCRGLYVAITRGQVENLVLVVTDSHDVADAVDVLDKSWPATAPTDPPPVSAATSPPPHPPPHPPPAPVVQPLCEIPPWYEETRQVVHAEFLDALGRLRAEHAEEERVDQRIDELGVLLDELEPACQPHDDAIDAARNALDDAKATDVNSNEPSTTAAGVNAATPDANCPPLNATSPPPNTTSTTSPSRPAPSSISAPSSAANAAISSATSETSGLAATDQQLLPNLRTRRSPTRRPRHLEALGRRTPHRSRPTRHHRRHAQRQ